MIFSADFVRAIAVVSDIAAGFVNWVDNLRSANSGGWLNSVSWAVWRTAGASFFRVTNSVLWSANGFESKEFVSWAIVTSIAIFGSVAGGGRHVGCDLGFSANHGGGLLGIGWAGVAVSWTGLRCVADPGGDSANKGRIFKFVFGAGLEDAIAVLSNIAAGSVNEVFNLGSADGGYGLNSIGWASWRITEASFFGVTNAILGSAEGSAGNKNVFRAGCGVACAVLGLIAGVLVSEAQSLSANNGVFFEQVRWACGVGSVAVLRDIAKSSCSSALLGA